MNRLFHNVLMLDYRKFFLFGWIVKTTRTVKTAAVAVTNSKE